MTKKKLFRWVIEAMFFLEFIHNAEMSVLYVLEGQILTSVLSQKTVPYLAGFGGTGPYLAEF